MTRLSRVLLSLLIVLATLLLANCGGSYSCQVTFGSSTCTPSGSGVSSSGGSGGSGGGSGGGGGSGSLPSAYAYAVDQGGTIDGYVLNASQGTFTAISGYTAPIVPTNNGGVGMVVAQQQYLYAGFGAVNQIYGWTISSSGSLTAISGSPFSATFLNQYSGGVSQDNMITNPAGTLLFVSDAMLNEIYVLQIGSGGALTEVTGSPFACPTGFGTPMNLGTDGMGKYLYVVDGNFSTHQGTQVAAFTIGTGTSLGVLTPITGSPFAFPMWQLKGEPTGQFLIGTSGSSAYYTGVTDDDNLYVFSITQSGANAGAITQLAKQATVYSPFSIAVQSNTGGDLVYSLGFNDTATAFNPIEGYTITSTGGLTADTGSPFALSNAEGSWGQFDQSGGYLFTYASYLNSTTNTTVTQLAPLTVGTGGALSQPESPFSIVTPGFWVVTDPQ
jgi:hypothetical protein